VPVDFPVGQQAVALPARVDFQVGQQVVALPARADFREALPESDLEQVVPE
jgi:hypothetical protein